MKRAFLLPLLFIAFCSYAQDAAPTWVYRDPYAWSAIKKYCITCHSAETLDKAQVADWSEQIQQCYLHMASRGYPRPTAKDREALERFLPQVLPADRKPPVYMYSPGAGSLSVP